MTGNDVDVVIVTRDRPSPLAALLNDLRTQTEAPGSIVIVDDSTAPVDWSARFPELPLVVVHPAERLFVSAAKNQGISRGRREFVAFIDDDNRLPNDLLACLSRRLRSDPSLGAVMPGVVYYRKPELVWVYATPFRRDRWGFELIGRDRPRDPAWEARDLKTDALPNLSMARRSALEAVGGVDEQFRTNSSADLCQRLKGNGWEVVADTTVLTRHDVDPPGVPGYWAEHTVVDPVRARYEVADWFRFHRRWNRRGPLFSIRATYHALGFLLPQLVAAGMRPDAHRIALVVALLRGYRDGLGMSLREPPRSRRRPTSSHE